MSYYPNYVYSLFAFLGFFLVLIPFPWHFEAWNTGTCLYMAWSSLACLNYFINSVIWTGNAINWSPTWCDISSRIIVGAAVAIPASSLCINRRLYHIARCNAVMVTKKEKRRAIFVDLSICLGIPLVDMILQYIVQGHRFDIYEDIGCLPFTYNVWPAYPLVFVWPIAIGIVSAVYASLSIFAFYKRRLQFKELLSANSTNLNTNRYIRLMCLAGLEILLTIPLCSYFIWVDVSVLGLNQYKGWTNVHWGFHRVDQFPSIIWHADKDSIMGLELTRWGPILCSFVFFSFFGFAEEARKHYRSAFTTVAKRVGYTFPATSSSGLTTSNGMKKSLPFMSVSGGGLPVFIRKQAVSNRDSLGSFTLTIADAGGALDNTKSAIYSPTDSSVSQTSLPSSSAPAAPPPPPVISKPEPTLDITSPIRTSAESASPASPRRSLS